MTILRVDGMMCGHCTASVEEMCRSVSGVTSATADLESGRVTVEGKASAEELIAAVSANGSYTCALDEPTSSAEPVTVLRIEGMMW